MSQDNTKGDEVTDTPPTYKEQLDEAAIKVKNPQGGASEGGVIGRVVEKGTNLHYSNRGFSDMRLIDIGRAVQYPNMFQPLGRS